MLGTVLTCFGIADVMRVRPLKLGLSCQPPAQKNAYSDRDSLCGVLASVTIG